MKMNSKCESDPFSADIRSKIEFFLEETAMEKYLFCYKVIVPLLYDPYDVHSYDPDSECVFVLDTPLHLEWQQSVEQGEFKAEEKLLAELSSREDGMFELELCYIYVEGKAEARMRAAIYAEKVCRALDLLLAEDNVNLHCYQPHLYFRPGEMRLTGMSYEKYEAWLQEQDRKAARAQAGVSEKISENIVEIGYIFNARESDVQMYMKASKRVNGSRAQVRIGEILERQKDPEIAYLCECYSMALGGVDYLGRCFHLLAIIEYIEKAYGKMAGAKPIFTENQQKDMRKLLRKYIEEQGITNSADLAGRFKDKLAMPDMGWEKRLLAILHAMEIREIDKGSVQVTVDQTLVKEIIGIRNQNFHGDVSRFDGNKALVDKLLCLCLEIIHWVMAGCRAG